MKETICDICKKNKANESYKIKRSTNPYFVKHGNGPRGWLNGFGPYEKIDICDECMEKLFEVKKYGMRPALPPKR